MNYDTKSQTTKFTKLKKCVLAMDTILCDELLQEIFQRLPPPSSSSSPVSLVSKRWLRLLRSSTSALSLTFVDPPILPSLSSFLSHHPFLSSLSLSTGVAISSDQLLLSLAFSCPNLRRLRFFSDPVSLFSLLSLSTSCPRLSSLTISICRPLYFQWLPPLRYLKDLSICVAGSRSHELAFDEAHDAELNLESLCLSGIQVGDFGLNYLWRNCKGIKKLELQSCEGVGDNPSFSAFIKSLKTLEHVELRTCRTIVEGVLLKLAQHSVSLYSLLVYDGGNKEGLLQFISQGRCNIQKLDLRLPLDLNNDHLIAISENFRCLSSLRLQSCYLFTGEGLQAIAWGVSNELQELALINCDVVERESGLLTLLGQNLKRLRKLDLSYNEMLHDKELSSMLVSCGHLNELKLRGCGKLTGAAMISMAKNCQLLETVDIMYCHLIDSESVECFLTHSSNLRQLQVEDRKVSVAARVLASDKLIEVVDD